MGLLSRFKGSKAVRAPCCAPHGPIEIRVRTAGIQRRRVDSSLVEHVTTLRGVAGVKGKLVTLPRYIDVEFSQRQWLPRPRAFGPIEHWPHLGSDGRRTALEEDGGILRSEDEK